MIFPSLCIFSCFFAHPEFFLFKFIHLNMRLITLQYTDGTRTSLQVTEDQDSRTWHKRHGWLKRAWSVKEEETIFHWCMWRLSKYHPDLFVVIEHVFTDWFSPHLDNFLFLCTSGIFFFLNLYILVRGKLLYNIVKKLGKMLSQFIWKF